MWTPTSRTAPLTPLLVAALAGCGTDVTGAGGSECAPAAALAISPDSVDSSSRYIDGNLPSMLGLSRSAVVGTVSAAAVDDEDGRGLRDGRVTLSDTTVVWRNPATRTTPPDGEVVADYLATSTDDEGARICTGERVLVLLTQPEDAASDPPVHLAQVAYPLEDGEITAQQGGADLPTALAGVAEGDLGAALTRVETDIPEPLSDVVDLPMDERLIELDTAEDSSPG